MSVPRAALRTRSTLRVALVAAPLVLSACKGGAAEAPDPTAADPDFFADADPEPAADPLPEPIPEPASEPEPLPPRPAQSIFRSELVRVTNFGPAYLLRELQPEPFRHSGRFVGWEITQVFPDDPGLCAPGCDLEVGDVVLSVNGSRLETPQQLSDEFEKIPKLSTLTVVSLRNEKRRSVRYTIVEDLGAAGG